MAETLYDRVRLGAWIQANAPADYGPSGRIKMEARPDGLCAVLAYPEDLPAIPAPEDLPSGALTDVERMSALFTEARRGAPLLLDQLKATVWVALVGGGMDPADATAAGVGLVLRFGAELAAFTSAGGHPVAAAALYAAISSPESVAALPWLSEPILAVFAGALTPS